MTGRRMTRPEAITLCRLAKAACPQQQFDEWTPDVWAEILGDLRFTDCKDALMACVSAKPFCAPAEVRTEVARIRRRRIDDYGDPPTPPRELADDPIGYAEWMGRAYQRIGDGEGDLLAQECAALEATYSKRTVPELEGFFPRVHRANQERARAAPDDQEPA